MDLSGAAERWQPSGKPHFQARDPEILLCSRLTKCAKPQKALIPLHFGNPELHNKLLASRHPNMG
jgi:hypothetical protein